MLGGAKGLGPPDASRLDCDGLDVGLYGSYLDGSEEGSGRFALPRGEEEGALSGLKRGIEELEMDCWRGCGCEGREGRDGARSSSSSSCPSR